jgi:hypothetical protein
LHFLKQERLELVANRVLKVDHHFNPFPSYSVAVPSENQKLILVVGGMCTTLLRWSVFFSQPFADAPDAGAMMQRNTYYSDE